VTKAEQQRSKSLDERAVTLMRAANVLIGEGQLRDAADFLESAAQLHFQAGRNYDEARCSQLAATLRRFSGDSKKSDELIQHAASIKVDDQPLAVSIAIEAAETAATEYRFDETAERWTTAVNAATDAGLLPDGMSAILRRRAAALLKLGRLSEAEADMARAFELACSAHGEQAAVFLLIEQASQLWDAGQCAAAEATAARIEGIVERASGNAHLKAELLLLRARFAKSQKDFKATESYARQARSLALQAVAPVSYFSASVQLAEVLQDQDECPQAYGALTTAWATLSDLLGNDVARSWVEPCLLGYQIRWGKDRFEEAKSAYEARRRFELSREA
jgi:tetratricopeptide (TPR) repeat protein